MSNEVLIDAIKYLPAKVVPALVGMISIPILTHMLSPAQYGEYLLAIASLTLISSFCVSWLVSVIIRFYVVYEYSSFIRVTRKLLISSIIMGCIFWPAAALIIGSPLYTPRYIYIGLIWIVSQTIFEYVSGWYRAKNQAKLFSFAAVWRSVIGVIVAIVMLKSGFEGGDIVIGASAFAMMSAMIFLSRSKVSLSYELSRGAINQNVSISELLMYGIPSAFINLATIGIIYADRFILEAYLGASSLAVYGASNDIAEKTIFFINSILLLSSSVVGFKIFDQQGEIKAAEFMNKLMRLYLLIATPLVVMLALLSDKIVTTLLPSEYSEGAILLSIVSIGGFVVGIMHRYSLLLGFHKRADINMYCAVFALIVDVALCYILIPLYGMVGAALSKLFAYFSWYVLVRLATMRYVNPRFPWGTFVRVIGSLLVVWLAVSKCAQYVAAIGVISLLVDFIFGLLVYACFLYVLGEISKNDIKTAFWAIVSKFRNT